MRKALLLLSLLLFAAFAATEIARSVSPASALAPKIEKRDVQVFKGAAVTPEWQELLLRAREEGWKGSLNGPSSGVRTYKQQQRLWRKFQRGKGAPAFPPKGPSRHLESNVRSSGSWSQAVDVSRPASLIKTARKFGVELHQPYPSEPWHIEAAKPFSLSLSAALFARFEEGWSKLFAFSASLLALAAILSAALLFMGSRQSRFLLCFFLPCAALSLFISSPLYSVACFIFIALFSSFLWKASSPGSRAQLSAIACSKDAPERPEAFAPALSCDWPAR